MRRLATSIAPTVVTGIAGLLTFVSLFVPALAPLRGALVSIAVIIAGFAVVLGFFHLVLGVHVQRIRQGKGALYSLVLILAAGVTAGLMIAERLLGTPDYPAGAFIFNNIVMPMQSALGALLAFFLALAAFRMLHRRRSFSAVWFLLSALIVLITQIPMPGLNPADGAPSILGAIRSVLDAVTTGGMRGLLLGVALGTIATAFRVLFFIDRPQSE